MYTAPPLSTRVAYDTTVLSMQNLLLMRKDLVTYVENKRMWKRREKRSLIAQRIRENLIKNHIEKDVENEIQMLKS